MKRKVEGDKFKKQPNVLYILADQWRAQSFGYTGNPDVKTPNIDNLAAHSINMTNAVAGCSVCCPARASMLTGQYPLTHGVFVNDVNLGDTGPSIAQALESSGYETGFIGKWHVDGNGRSDYIPPERRKGFNYWKALECTHDYNESFYFSGRDVTKRQWDGYDAIAQTSDVEQYLRDHRESNAPFFLLLSWGPPHAPYDTAPQEYRAMYDSSVIKLPPNVPESSASRAREWLAGYYAHCTALDDCVGRLRSQLEEVGLAENTIVLFTSDHGDMLGSQGHTKKQKPWEESVRVPFLLHCPSLFGSDGRKCDAPIDSPDVMPTLLGLCGVSVPRTVEGVDFSEYLGAGPGAGSDPSDGSVLLASYHPFGQWPAAAGGIEYRGIRTRQYTYVRSLHSAWLLYDNTKDPHQMNNLVDAHDYADVQRLLETQLQEKLKALNDDFLPGLEYVSKW
eukprot:CAMPEP_0114421732 /NCGR_PEP_ID=MMETSP0103-20121206/5236_1 /TAXON_ID=37642 ORGANISM="Paraphysomonas imperforata, Strain PA2" /NCGR_SAMPLE_ID=MMETSP0103 /ASSEMBLY_ACC=CAM_ASM_000201 /LENGTH=448 /DNA_ID=CAMNT_0001590275 /DNA_START=74 /DNA_END=1417 /DNA_ORIENTATION=-